MSTIKFARLPYTADRGSLYLVRIASKHSIGSELVQIPGLDEGLTNGEIWKFIKDYVELLSPHSLDSEEHKYLASGLTFSPYGEVPFDEEGNVAGDLLDVEEYK